MVHPSLVVLVVMMVVMVVVVMVCQFPIRLMHHDVQLVHPLVWLVGHPCYPSVTSPQDWFQIRGHSQTTSECKIPVRIWLLLFQPWSQNGRKLAPDSSP